MYCVVFLIHFLKRCFLIEQPCHNLFCNTTFVGDGPIIQSILLRHVYTESFQISLSIYPIFKQPKMRVLTKGKLHFLFEKNTSALDVMS